MARSRLKSKGRKDHGSFIQIPHQCLEHTNYAALPSRAVKLLLDLYGQYRGSNNGDFCCAFSVMKKRGWRSKATLDRAQRDLLTTGWIVLTRQGGKNMANLYAVTFKPIDECGGKLDRRASATALAYWKEGCNPERLLSECEK